MAEIILKQDSEHDFEVLFSMEKSRLNLLISRLKDSKPGLSPQKISENLYKELEMTSDNLEKVIQLIFDMNRVKLSSGFDTEKVIDDFLKAVKKYTSKIFQSESIREYLETILQVEGSVFLTVSAKNLVFLRDNILTDTDIETDVRPIFKDDEFKGLVIIHTLKIDFAKNDSDEQSVVRLGLDKDDMDKLEKLIQRAKLRELSLKKNISNTFVDFS